VDLQENKILNMIKPTEEPLAEQAAGQISQYVIEQHIESGDKLPNEFELAAQLNVGRGTIREAVKILVARNVLQIRRGKGTYVAKHTGVIEDPLGFAFVNNDIKLAKDLLEMRMVIETWVVRIAAERATEVDLQKITEACNKVRNQLEQHINHLEADEKFHIALARCTHNLVVPKLIPIIVYSVQQLGPMNFQAKDYNIKMRKKTIMAHEKILKAILSRDGEAAAKAMLEHLKDNQKVIELYEKEKQ
jgi:DNA-binding FadR family transcriptional regulator